MENPAQHEPALEPEDLARFFVQRASAGDVEGLVASYEPDAVLAFGDGQKAVGTEAIRRFYIDLLRIRSVFEAGQQSPPPRNGDLALTSSRLANGRVTAQIARRQPDGTWLWSIDQPSLGT